MDKFKIALTQALSDEGMAYLVQYAQPYVIGSSDANVLLEALHGFDGLISRGGRLDRVFFEQAAKLGLKVVGKTSAGVDSVDLEAATEYSIPVVYTPGANARSVAEYTVAGMLAANKQFIWSNTEMHNSHREYRDDYLGNNFEGKRVLLLGFGNIGRQVAAMCKGLSIQVTVYDKYISPEAVQAQGFEYTDDFYKTLPEADFISVHMPLTQETRGMLGGQEMEQMKPGAIIINTARGGIVDEKALVAYLKTRRLGGAVMDVVEGEPDISNSPLIGCDNVILSGHVAGQTRQSLFATARDCTDGVVAVLQKKKWPRVANPAVYNCAGWED